MSSCTFSGTMKTDPSNFLNVLLLEFATMSANEALMAKRTGFVYVLLVHLK